MRFHCGISFSWRSIKKFLFPFLIGLLTYFGFSFLSDNTSLGFIKVKALEDESNESITEINDIEDDYNYLLDTYSFNESSDLTTHKPLYDVIYWLDDNNTEKGILTSIYELLFLYCLTMICFRILTFLKNNRW